MQKRQLFTVVVVRRGESVLRILQSDPELGSQTQDGMYSLEQLSAIRRALKCDAVLTGTVTVFRPYPHMTIGLRLKLVDLTDGQLLWAFEEVWDTADKTTERRIESYFQRDQLLLRLGPEPLAERLVTVSSLKFVKFVVYEVAQTLRAQRQDKHSCFVLNDR